MELNERAIEAAKMYLVRREYDILLTDSFGFDIIAMDCENDAVVFIDVFVRKGDMPAEAAKSAKEFEALAGEFMSAFDSIIDKALRYDVICMNVSSNDRAMLKHHINAIDLFSDIDTMRDKAWEFMSMFEEIKPEEAKAILKFAEWLAEN